MQKQTKIGKKISFSKWISEPSSEKGTQIFYKFELRLKFWFICCTNICGVFHCCIMQQRISVRRRYIWSPCWFCRAICGFSLTHRLARGFMRISSHCVRSFKSIILQRFIRVIEFTHMKAEMKDRRKLLSVSRFL